MFAIVFSVILIVAGSIVGIVLAKLKTSKLMAENEERARYVHLN